MATYPHLLCSLKAVYRSAIALDSYTYVLFQLFTSYPDLIYAVSEVNCQILYTFNQVSGSDS